MQIKFDLNFIELMSLVCCLDCLDHNTYYFVSAGFLYLMQLKHLIKLGRIKETTSNNLPETNNNRGRYFGRNIDFGWQFLNFSLKLYYKEFHDSNIESLMKKYNVKVDYIQTTFKW